MSDIEQQDVTPAKCDRCSALAGQLYLDAALSADDLLRINSTSPAVAVFSSAQAGARHCQLCASPQLALPFEGNDR